MDNSQGLDVLGNRLGQIQFENNHIRTEFQDIINEYKSLYHNMLDSVDVYMSLVGSNMEVIWANKNTIDLFGPDIIGKPCNKICNRHNEPCCNISKCLVMKAFKSGREHRGHSDVLVRNGEKMFFSGSAKVITRDSDGKPTSVIRIYNDVTEQKKTELELKRSMLCLRNNLSGTIQAMAMTVESRDPYTAGHQRRTSDIARCIAQELVLPRKQVDGIRMAGVIHDLGKISIPAEILSKPGKICSPEYSLIKSHPQTGYDILKGIDFQWPVAEIVRQHHERLDGSGYPFGLTGDDIMLEARIVGVADVIEAMSSHRPYRPALGVGEAFNEIRKNKGKLYDPDVVEASEKVFAKKEFVFH